MNVGHRRLPATSISNVRQMAAGGGQATAQAAVASRRRLGLAIIAEHLRTLNVERTDRKCPDSRGCCRMGEDRRRSRQRPSRSASTSGSDFAVDGRQWRNHFGVVFADDDLALPSLVNQRMERVSAASTPV